MKKVIYWDLDRTLGKFTMGFEIREGIAPLLEQLADTYDHIITTSGKREYAESALEKANLRSKFAAIFGARQIFCNGKKYYSELAKKYGNNGFVVGDHNMDEPNVKGLVFIHQPSGYLTRAAVLLPVFESFKLESTHKQFEALVQNGGQCPHGHSTKQHNTTQFCMEYRTAPTIFHITDHAMITVSPKVDNF